MDTSPDTSDRSGPRLRTAAALVTLLGLYQGAVPLVARLAFGADQRFAPALWLPAPWWWIACVAIVVVTLVVLAAIDTSRAGHDPAPPTDPGADEEDERSSPQAPVHDSLSGLVFLAGVYNGVAPFVARLVLDRDGLLLALPLRLPAPWWWITSLAVIAVAIALLAVIDHDKQRRHSSDDDRDGSQSGIPSPE